MHTPPTPFDLQTIAARWQAFDSVAHVRPIRSPEDYERMVALMDSLLVATGDDEDHPLSSLLDLVGDVVEKYEREHYAIEAASPKDALRFLMDERGLKQEDLASLIVKSENEPDQPPWFNRTLFPPMPVTDQWRVSRDSALFSPVTLETLHIMMRKVPVSIKLNTQPKDGTVVFVVPPGEERMVPAVELAEFQPAILERDERIYKTIRKNQGLFFCALIVAMMLLFDHLNGVILLIMAFYTCEAGYAHIAAWHSLRKIKANPAQYLAEMGPNLRYAFWLTILPTSPLTRTQALVFCWVFIAIFQYGAVNYGGHGRPDILAAGLVKSLVADQPWRLLTGPMLHTSMLHILMNGLAMLALGKWIERSAHRYLVVPVWLLGALAGSLLSWLVLPSTSIGASGGVMAVLGFFLVMASKRRAQLPPGLFRELLRSLILTALIGILAWNVIDNAAHLGGLISGGLLGLWVFRDARASLPLKDQPFLRVAGVGAELFLLGLSIFTVVKLC
jgi:HTH-type transcriptional regulator / antitoxin HigA